ncbi:Tetraspanin [Fasciolopsis buskii]|uniref:Tetraspanin n=1 Tax=Fasciolopsis buskii TaxID=27845 RepID=A0A8E0RQU5_9TREM|nr:Tetraspanin [Fasciolopsis buski]KAA0185179.1 Tetraspanin [Fasciolopsis buski]
MVSLSCGYKCLQVILVIMNVVVTLCGIALIVVGSLSLANFSKYGTSDGDYLKAFAIFIVAFGCFITLVGIFGFCGACKKSVYCLTLVKEYFAKGIEQAFAKYDDPMYKKFVDTIQKDLKCCGINGTWTGSGTIPASCQGPSGPYTDGCVKNVQQFFKKNILIVAVCVFVFALIQILGIVFAVCVCQAIKRGETA